MRHSKLILAGLAASVLMAFAVSSASANRLSITNRNLRVAWSALLINSPELEFGEIRCSLILEGSFHYGTIVKREGALIGHISKAFSGCSILSSTLPWHLTYQGFRGRLPNIEAVRILLVGLALRIGSPFGPCLLRTTVEHPGRFEAVVEAGGNTTVLVPDREASIPFMSGESCPYSVAALSSGPTDGQVTLLGSTNRIRITLI
jgi:hypothetical protein